MDRAGELDLALGQRAVLVLGQQAAEDQHRVERRAQLVRHVGQELRLVLRGQRELGGLLLEPAPRQLDLLVLDLDVAVLLGQQARLLLELVVGLAQLLGLLLELLREALGLGQQLLGAHVGADRVEHDADRLGDPGEEVAVDLGERTHRGELDHAEHLILEQHRHDQDVGRGWPRRGPSRP